jgi:hypothetical protein
MQLPTDRIPQNKMNGFRVSMDDLIRQTKQKPPPPKPSGHLAFIGWLVAALLGGLFLAKLDQPKPVAAVVAAVPTPTAAPILSTPTSTPRTQIVTPVAPVTPRAQLIHVRPLGTVEDDRMPDGRILTTKYMGELSSAARLPTYGASLGDMWYTMNDGHCWVLAPIGTGSASVGWVDP